MLLVLKERQQAQPAQFQLKRKLLSFLGWWLLYIVGDDILHCSFQRVIERGHLSCSEYGEELLFCLADEWVGFDLGQQPGLDRLDVVEDEVEVGAGGRGDWHELLFACFQWRCGVILMQRVPAVSLLAQLIPRLPLVAFPLHLLDLLRLHAFNIRSDQLPAELLNHLHNILFKNFSTIELRKRLQDYDCFLNNFVQILFLGV